MNITDHLISHKTAHALDALSDNSRTQMAHMKGLCHIGAAVIHDDRFLLFRFFQSQLVRLCHTLHIICQKRL